MSETYTGRMLRLLLALACAMTPLAEAAQPKPVWESAEIVSVNVSTTESQEVSMSAADGTFPPSSIVRRKSTTYIYVLKAGNKVVNAKLTGKPLAGLKENDNVRIAVMDGDHVQILVPSNKRPR